MGNNFLDQYSYLHFSSGVIAYFWGVSMRDWFLIHLTFEVIENTKMGAGFIDSAITMWPGGKKGIDSPINILGDHVSAMAGWLSARELDGMGSRRGWFDRHLDA